MHRSIRIALWAWAGVVLLAPEKVPPMLPDSTTMSFSGSALAQSTPMTDSINLNSSRSNIYREAATGGTTAPNPPKNQTVNTTQSGNGQQPPAPARGHHEHAGEIL
jgi:hypothetical protein